MQVGNKTYAGKGAREEAAKSLTFAMASLRNDQTLQNRATFRGFEILSRGKQNDETPELFIRGGLVYTANLNPANPVGTVQSIEHALRNLDKVTADQRIRLNRIEKELDDYKEQSDRPFEHQGKLQELLRDKPNWPGCWIWTRVTSKR